MWARLPGFRCVPIASPRVRPMQQQQPSAVCVTGESRSFSEIGHNVREGVLLLLGSPAIRFFGVRPEHDRWELLQAMLPFAKIGLQWPCWSAAQLNWTQSWLHCDMRQRQHDCRASFLQQLCDMQQCSAMITAYETKQAVQFHRIVRLRPDMYWEARVVVPAALRNGSVYMPKADNGGGVNDHLAFGMRAPMLRYLRRIRHAHHGLADIEDLQGRTGEYHLRLSLKRDGVTPTPLPSWATCMHTRRALLGPMSSGYRGCVGRVRCRTSCASLLCKESGFMSGECECFNETCATLATGVSHTDQAPARLFTLCIHAWRVSAVTGTRRHHPVRWQPDSYGRAVPEVRDPCVWHVWPAAQASIASGGTAHLYRRWAGRPALPATAVSRCRGAPCCTRSST